MGQLYLYLPPFASDYSGVCSALFDFKCLTVINDPGCCTSHFVFYDEPRWNNLPGSVFSAGLRNLDAVCGNEQKIVNSVRQAAVDCCADMIALVNTPVPALTGMDAEGIAAEIEIAVGIETYGFNTTGFAGYDRGIAAVGKALIDRHSKTVTVKEKRSLNIIGMTPLDFGDVGNNQDLQAMLSSAGWQVNCCLFQGTNLENIKRIGEAEVNLAVSAAGIVIAKYLQKKFLTPYIPAFPLGKKHREEILALLDGKEPELRAGTGEPSLLIVSDQIMGNSLRTFLHLHGYELNIDVASFFGWAGDCAQAGDIALTSEKHLLEILRKGRYKAIIGDPLLSNLPEVANKFVHYKIAHPAVSGKLNWKKVPRYQSAQFEVFIDRIDR